VHWYAGATYTGEGAESRVSLNTVQEHCIDKQTLSHEIALAIDKEVIKELVNCIDKQKAIKILLNISEKASKEYHDTPCDETFHKTDYLHEFVREIGLWDEYIEEYIKVVNIREVKE